MYELERTRTMERDTFSLKTAEDRRNAVGGWLMALAVFAVVALVASPVAAQEEPTEDDDVPEGPLSEQLDDYWSVDRDVDAIKNKMFRREGRVAVGLYGGIMSSEPFFWYSPVGLRVDYYLSDNFGLELEGSYMGAKNLLRHDTDLTGFVRNEKPGFDESSDALDIFKWRAHALAVWSPFYGKLALLQRKLAHFDLNLAAGFGAVSIERPNKTRTDSQGIVTPEFVFGGGVQFFANNHITIRFTGRGYVYSGPMNFKNTETGERYVSANTNNPNIKEANFFQKLETPTEFLLGVSYMF
jgi:outer membrane beta-barrel protein